MCYRDFKCNIKQKPAHKLLSVTSNNGNSSFEQKTKEYLTLGLKVGHKKTARKMGTRIKTCINYLLFNGK